MELDVLIILINQRAKVNDIELQGTKIFVVLNILKFMTLGVQLQVGGELH